MRIAVTASLSDATTSINAGGARTEVLGATTEILFLPDAPNDTLMVTLTQDNASGLHGAGSFALGAAVLQTNTAPEPGALPAILCAGMILFRRNTRAARA